LFFFFQTFSMVWQHHLFVLGVQGAGTQTALFLSTDHMSCTCPIAAIKMWCKQASDDVVLSNCGPIAIKIVWKHVAGAMVLCGWHNGHKTKWFGTLICCVKFEVHWMEQHHVISQRRKGNYENICMRNEEVHPTITSSTQCKELWLGMKTVIPTSLTAMTMLSDIWQLTGSSLKLHVGSKVVQQYKHHSSTKWMT